VLLEGLGQLKKNSMTLSGLEPATFRLVLRYRVPPFESSTDFNLILVPFRRQGSHSVGLNLFAVV
jgi:hypothetical protein